MAPANPFSKEIFVRLDGNGAFVTIVKYGWFYSKTKEFIFAAEPSSAGFQENQPLLAKYFVPPATTPTKDRRDW